MLLLSSCDALMFSTEPKFYRGQKVKFRPSFFYSKVCSGNGEIMEFFKDADGKFLYTIRTSWDEIKCPSDYTGVPEYKIQAIE